MRTLTVFDELYEQLKSFVVDPYDDTPELIIGRLIRIARKATSRCLSDVWDSSDSTEYPAMVPEARPQPQPVQPLEEQEAREATPPSPDCLGGTSLSERFQRAKAALAKTDPLYASEGFWRGFESGPVDEAQVAGLEEMVRSYQQQDTQQQESQWAAAVRQDTATDS